MMWVALFAASALPLVSVAADDARVQDERAFVSPKAELALAASDGEDVLCLDRRQDRYSSICLVRSEWNEAVALANAGRGDRRSNAPRAHFRDPWFRGPSYGLPK